MQSLHEIINRIRSSRVWRALAGAPARPVPPRPLLFDGVHPILREVTPHGVRVYSLCGQCGAQLSASATLCEACARSRSIRNS